MSEPLIPLALDTETDLIGPGKIAPPMICASFAWREPDGSMVKKLLGNHPDDGVEEAIRKVLESERHLIMTARGAYDLAVIASTYPKLIPLIFAALREGRVDDVQIREKLLNLSTHGQLESIRLPDKSTARLKYNLAVLEAKYLGRDRTAEKDAEDAWRLNYRELDGLCAVNYPDEARDYALADASGTLEVYEAQEELVLAGVGSVETSTFQTTCDFALYLMTCWGFAVDQEEVAKVEKVVADALAPEKLELLFQAGILRRGEAARPHANKKKAAIAELQKLLPDQWGPSIEKDIETGAFTWDQYMAALVERGIKFKEAVEPTRDTKVLKRYINTVCAENELPVKLTDTGREKNGYVPTADPNSDVALEYAAADGDFMGMLVAVSKDPVLKQYEERMELDKLITTYLPALRGNAVIHPNYNVLVETGRTSSYGAPKDKLPLYPAVNIQQQPKEMRGANVRHCFVPRPGLALWDVDYQALELACVGQITQDLFGQSVHFDLYNSGVDLHAYLAAQLALRLGKDPAARMFQQACVDERIAGQPLDVYRAFLRCKGADGDLGVFFKHYRDFAKPTGLGFPGGLGAKKMVTFARTQYEVIITEEEAAAFKQVWLDTYPEMPAYFEWVKSQHDELNPEVGDEDGEFGSQKGLWYTTPLGMVRRGTTYCGVANGKAMQSPGGELAKLANFNVSRACYDETQGSVLFGARPIAFVHDQIIGETTEDQDIWHEQCIEVSKIMVDSASMILPGIKMRTEPLLTTVWSKKAVPTYDDNKRLIPWTP